MAADAWALSEASGMINTARRPVLYLGGGVVHASAAGDVEWLVDRALATPDCCARWPEPGQKFQKGELAFFAAGQVPAGWVPLSELQRTVPGAAV